MPSINDRIGSQNVIRVLSNASAPPSSVISLNDVDSTLKTRDGMILVWDLDQSKFFMTDQLDSTTLSIAGIVTFSNTTNSSAPTNGALVINGGIGIAKQVHIGESVSVAGIATFSSNVDINAAVDILNGVTAQSTFKSVGVTTLASSGGITTTGGDLYVAGDLNVNGDLVYDEASARNWNISGIATVGTLLNVSGNTNLTKVNVSGISTFVGVSTFKSDLYVDGNLNVIGDIVGSVSGNVIGRNLNISGIATIGTLLDLNGNLNVSGVSTFVGVATYSDNLFVSGTLTAGLIDGGTY